MIRGIYFRGHALLGYGVEDDERPLVAILIPQWQVLDGDYGELIMSCAQLLEDEIPCQ